METGFIPDLAAVIDAAVNEDPALIVYAINSQLGPIVDLTLSSGAEVDREELLWILMEITLNAVNAKVGSSLAEVAGYSREKLLEVFQVNILYPDSTVESKDYSGPDAEAVSSVLGMSIPRFVKLSLSDKLLTLGVTASPGWITIDVSLSEDYPAFSILVRSEDPISDEDHEEIIRRFREPDLVKREVLERRKPWEDEQGVFRMPSFTGGGGVGLLECIRLAAEAGIVLEYIPGRSNRRSALFRVSFPGNPEASR
jgi:hypothetical protein